MNTSWPRVAYTTYIPFVVMFHTDEHQPKNVAGEVRVFIEWVWYSKTETELRSFAVTPMTRIAH